MRASTDCSRGETDVSTEFSGEAVEVLAGELGVGGDRAARRGFDERDQLVAVGTDRDRGDRARGEGSGGQAGLEKP
jgi:hypothetical protein